MIDSRGTNISQIDIEYYLYLVKEIMSARLNLTCSKNHLSLAIFLADIKLDLYEQQFIIHFSFVSSHKQNE